MPVLSKAALRKAALTAAERGWHVFPLRPDARRGDPDHPKRPAFPDHGEQQCRGTDPRCTTQHTGWETRATTDYERIIRAWAWRPYGVGIACGPSGLVVIDLDVAKGRPAPPAWAGAGVRDGGDVFAVLCERAGQPFPATYTVQTASGGLHLYFRHPSGAALRNTAGERGGGLGWLIDTRAHGGYVVAAGSSVAGRAYEVLDDRDPLPLPGWLTALLRPAAADRPVMPALRLGDDRAGRYARAALERTLAMLADAGQGGRNHALFMAAQTLGQLVASGALAAETVITALTEAALALGLGEAETAKTIRSGLAAGARRPRAVTA